MQRNCQRSSFEWPELQPCLQSSGSDYETRFWIDNQSWTDPRKLHSWDMRFDWRWLCVPATWPENLQSRSASVDPVSDEKVERWNQKSSVLALSANQAVPSDFANHVARLASHSVPSIAKVNSRESHCLHRRRPDHARRACFASWNRWFPGWREYHDMANWILLINCDF